MHFVRIAGSAEERILSRRIYFEVEAEINAMATCCRELFPILDVVKELSGAIGLSAQDGASMHIRLHEDNAGALTTDLPKFLSK